MKTYSEVTGLEYEEEKCVFFRNWLQASKYIQWGARLIDLFPSRDDKFVYVFLRSDHEKFRDKWGTVKNNNVGGDGNDFQTKQE